jgi:hypothetical protein
MSLLGCGVFILGVVLGGLVFLMLLSLLAMARECDESLEQLELAMLRTPKYPPSHEKGKIRKPRFADHFRSG